MLLVRRYRIEFAPSAFRQMKRLGASLKGQIGRSLGALEKEPRPQGCAKLKGAEDIFRIRVGGYRVLYQVRDDALVVLVVKVGNRRDIYKQRI